MDERTPDLCGFAARSRGWDRGPSTIVFGRVAVNLRVERARERGPFLTPVCANRVVLLRISRP